MHIYLTTERTDGILRMEHKFHAGNKIWLWLWISFCWNTKQKEATWHKIQMNVTILICFEYILWQLWNELPSFTGDRHWFHKVDPIEVTTVSHLLWDLEVRTYLIFLSWRGVLDTTLCDKVCYLLAAGRWFSPGIPVSSTNKTDSHDITKLLLKVALNTITP